MSFSSLCRGVSQICPCLVVHTPVLRISAPAMEAHLPFSPSVGLWETRGRWRVPSVRTHGPAGPRPRELAGAGLRTGESAGEASEGEGTVWDGDPLALVLQALKMAALGRQGDHGGGVWGL